MWDRPQKAVACWGRQMTCVVEDGQSHGWIGPMSVWALSEIVGVGTCEMIIGDESWYSLIALEIKTRAGVPLTVMAVCVRV